MGLIFFAFFEKFFVPILTSGGYVGLSIATLLSQHHKVTAVDIIPEKVDMINNRNIFVKTQRGRYSYLPPERNKFISERSLGESCKRECLEGFFVQNAEKNLWYKEEPILIFTTRTRLRLVVDLQENVKAQENLAYALKVKISNLQKMAETLV